MPSTRLTWDNIGERLYETGIDHVVLYVKDSTTPPVEGMNGHYAGVAWNGVTGITESPSGAEPTAIYADNIKYLNLLSNEELSLTLEALTYPDEFRVCDGTAQVSTGKGFYISQQKRKEFALCYRTLIGNDTEGNDKGYQIHIVYNCLAAPSERAHSTVNDTPETMTMSWSISTTPEEFTVGTGANAVTYHASAHVVLDSTEVDATKMASVLEELYGNDAGTKTPHLLTPDNIATIVNAT